MKLLFSGSPLTQIDLTNTHLSTMSACLLISFSSYDVSTVNDFQLPKIKLKYISLLRRTSLVFLEDFTQDAWR